MSTVDDVGHPDAPETRGAGEQMAEVLFGRFEGVCGADEIAAALTRSWIVIEGALGPVLGNRGVAALYKRSLQLSSAAHPWLAHLEEGASEVIDLKALHAAFIEQAHAQGLSAARGILLALCNLMVSLLGASLTERLLGSVLPNLPSDIRPETAR